MAQNPAFLTAAWAKSEEWKTGDKHNKPPDVISNFDDGSAARSHAELMRAATPEETSDLRVGLFFYGDEIEVRRSEKSRRALRAPALPLRPPARACAAAVRSRELSPDDVGALDGLIMIYLDLFQKVRNVPRNIPRNVPYFGSCILPHA